MFTAENMKNWLHEAKELHTKHYGDDPTHDWETWYSQFIINKIIQYEITELGKAVDANARFGKTPVTYTSGKPSKVISDFIRDPDHSPDPADYAASRVENPHRAG